MTGSARANITKIIFCNAMNPTDVVVVQNSDQAYRFIRGESIGSTATSTKVINFDEAISRVDAQIKQIEGVPDELMSPLLSAQLQELYALKQFLTEASQQK
jgi:hypothetical protein